MTWTRLDDTWTGRQVFEELPYEFRWHYLCLIQFCSRNGRYEGVIRRVDADRCSDVDDPAAAISALTTAGLVEPHDGGRTVRLPLIEEHIPPPSMRDERRKERQRTEKRRSRLHRAGDHSECLADRCEHAVSPDVSTDPGTGQDGTGRDEQTNTNTNTNTSDEHEVTVPAGNSNSNSSQRPTQDRLSELAQQHWEQGYEH